MPCLLAILLLYEVNKSQLYQYIDIEDEAMKFRGSLVCSPEMPSAAENHGCIVVFCFRVVARFSNVILALPFSEFLV